MKDTASFLAAAPRRRQMGPIPALLKRIGDRIRYGTLVIQTPGGDRFAFGEGAANEPVGVWEIKRWTALWALLMRGATGLAESYLDGHWDSPDLTALLQLAAVNERNLGACAAGNPLLLWGDRLRHRLRANSPRQARKNIAYHYDLGNAFYALWLDETMTYSAAQFEGPAESLEVAQTRKYAHLAQLVGVSGNETVLEIGCGWGGFLDYAAGTLGADVTGVSISRAQVDYARARMAGSGLEAKARVELRDYRDIDGCFDRIVSIEMFEAVGEAYWDNYACQVKRLLAPHGAAGLQVITIADDRFEQYRRTPDFIQRYIFPGGMLPTKTALSETFARVGLAVTASCAFGLDYARTLAHWRDRFDAAWPQIVALGFDERFRRLWHFYLGYCEAGFLSEAVDVVQIRLEHAQ